MAISASLKGVFMQQTVFWGHCWDSKWPYPYLDGFGSSLLAMSSPWEKGLEIDQFPRE